ncbi:outer membrane protein transport protein [Maribacter sp. ANRC-HE7]|uniref:Outer membrane protein transport protein n=1 Tax=Maribacter aquimaris TaxID=2737171 RepID=A0ABR7UXJ0_9FLAO|nr:outer membrane protein transport protein [Maribacter aquimaris]MBD0776917.1 outer membrane protein transport protein [Maribacter aquimaris]
MKNSTLNFVFMIFATAALAQSGHIMQGVGAVNMSMGGAATAQPLDISGALQWNPAAISAFDDKILKFDMGLFFSSPQLYSTVPEFDGAGQPTGNFFSGTTKDDRGVSPMPALAMVWGKEGSKHTFGASAFGISGFGVTFPESTTNPINMPQNMGGFGAIESDYILLQIGITYAYEISDQFSIGVEPTFNYATLELMPNPTANPSQTAGYPSTDKATALGFGAQFGVFYDSGKGFKAGASYKTTQSFGDFEFDNTYLDGSTGTNDFNMDYPAIYSLGLGYSLGTIDLALDYRLVDYENTDGFAETGWTPTASVAGFGWENISIISAGIQYKGIEKLPLRLGYTYSSNPINDEVAFFNIPATAVIKNAFQVGFSYEISDNLALDAVYHHGASGDATSGPLLNPMFIQAYPPYGAIPGSEVSYDMTTDMIMLGIAYTFKK